MTRAVTCTTRAPRAGEKDGVDYYFFDAAEFLKRVQAGNFIEHATVYGNSYGILKSELLGKLRAGQGRAAERGRAGRGDHPRAARKTEPELKRALVSVFLTPPSLAVLETAAEEARRGFGGGHPKAAGRGAAGNRAMEKFRLPADQRHASRKICGGRWRSSRRRRCARRGRRRRSFEMAGLRLRIADLSSDLRHELR